MQLALSVALLSPLMFAQTSGAVASRSLETTVLHVGTQLVIVDVTVVEKNGHPVHGLQREDFTLTESKQPQTVSHFEEHSTKDSPAAGAELPPMPPGTFTDYTSIPPNGTLNVLLLDTLNTPVADQSYVRSQLQQFVKRAKPGTRLAVFGLSTRLFLLQGFSSDPQILKNVVEHKLTPRPSDLVSGPAGTGPDSASDIASSMASQDSTGSITGVASALTQFEANQRAFQTQLRIQYTLDAFNNLAHYLSAFPGRKNLIWFSGSFPLDFLPDPTLESGFSIMEDNNPEFGETTNLLSRAQVAVYPVDARGLMSDPTFSAANRKSDPTGKQSTAFSQSQVSEHMTMSQLAQDTGGAAFYDTNDLASAVESAIDSGSNYYTLMYTPSNRNQNGSFREIRVSLNSNLEAAGYRLSYRRGYYTDQPNHSTHGSGLTTTSVSANSDELYARAAMAHGAPTPQDILFKVRVLPMGTIPEETLAPDNRTDPAHSIKQPFHRFAVDLSAVGNDFQLTPHENGLRSGAIEFTALLYDNDGQLLNATGKAVQLNLTPEAYKQFLSGVNAHLEISVPVKGSSDFLRIGIRDISANRFGVVEIPVASVVHLKPLPDVPATTSPVESKPQPAEQSLAPH
jgi:VWFA-related protein